MEDTKEIMRFAVEVGDQLLRNGAEIYRVEETVLRVLRSAGIEQCDVYVLSNGIFASANEDREDACSMIRHVPLGAIHLGRLAAMNQLVRDVCDHKCSIEDAWGRLAVAQNLPDYGLLAQIILCGIGSGGFCYLFGGTWGDAGVAFLVGMLEQIVLTLCTKGKITRFVKTIIASGSVSLICLGLRALRVPMHSSAVIVGAIMPLVPGIALTTSIRDFGNGDYLSGMIHMTDAILTAICVAIGSCLPLIIRSLLVTM